MRLIIVGTARCVWDDLSRSNLLSADIMAINDMICHYPFHLDYAFSLNKEMLNNWVEARQFPGKPEKHSKHVPHVKSSGMNAVYCGLDLGYDEIIVCGVPLDNSGHYFDPPWKKTRFNRNAGQKFDERVTFVSGRCSW